MMWLGKTDSGEAKHVFKGQITLSSPDGQVAGVRSGSLAQMEGVVLPSGIGTTSMESIYKVT
jgi:hypothetical protein